MVRKTPTCGVDNTLDEGYMEQVAERQKTRPRRRLSVPTTGALASGLKNFWYAVEYSSHVKAQTLQTFELFDRHWVLFRDPAGHIGCIQDECAHRACPLSLGTVVNGAVQCGYHGWQYDTHGECIHMPSCQPVHTAVESLPCIEREGLIWVCPAAQQPLEEPKQVQSVPQGFHVHAQMVMDLPVEHGLLLENLLDLAHAPFTHTGTFAKGWSVPELVRFMTPVSSQLSGHWEPYPIEMSFEPPCYVISKIGLRGRDCGRHLHQLHCCLPAGEGRTRLLYQLSLNFWGWARFLPGKDRFWRAMANRVIHEDLRLVVGQQERLATGGNVWKHPVGYDKLAVGYRRWRNQVERMSPEFESAF